MARRYLLALYLLLLGAGTASAQSAAPRVTLRGDVNLDGAVNASDALAVLTSLVGKSLPASYVLRPNGDANGDGEVTAADALIILSYAVSRDVGQFPVGRSMVRVSLDAPSYSLVEGQAQEARATVEGAGDSGLLWRSSAASVATVSGGVITAIAPGDATITAISTADTTSRAEARVTVARADVASVSVSPSASVFTALGARQSLAASVIGTNGKPMSGQAIAWSSSSPSVVSVDGSGVATAFANGSATITATVNGKSGTARVEVQQGIAAVELSPASASVKPGGSVQLTPGARDSGGSPVSGATYSFGSSNPGVATVSASGLVTGVSVGSTSITVSSGGRSASATVEVQSVAVASVALSPASLSLSVGQTGRLSAIPQDGAGGTLAGRTVTWSSADPAVATVSPGGVVTALKVGSTTVTATSEGKSSTATVQVSAAAPSTPVVSRVQISPRTLTLDAIGASGRLSASATDAGGTPVSTCKPAWSSLSSNVATVDTVGSVIARTVGIALLTASCGSITDTVSVTVRQVVASVAVSPSTGSLNTGQSLQLNAAVLDAGGTPVGGASVSWSSSNAAVATVSSSGSVTAVSGGSATITAASSGKSASAGLTVTAPVQPAPPVASSGEFVVYPNENVGFILGPQLKAGSSANPWLWFDQNALARGTYHGQFFPASPEQTPAGYEFSNLNYYDQALVQYQNYYRTGDPQYLSYARKIADAWWIGGGMDSGNNRNWDNSTTPRGASLGGLMLRAMDGRPEMWPWVTAYVDYMLNVWVEKWIPTTVQIGDIRDGGYMLLYATWLAKVHPDAAVRAQFQARALNVARNWFAAQQNADGGWYYADSGPKFNQPFQHGILLEGLISLHQLTGDAAVRTTILKASDWLINYAYRPAPWRGFWYYVYQDHRGDGTQNLAELEEARQLIPTAVHMLGYAYRLTRDPQYLVAGDEFFSAAFGRGQGPGADQYSSLAYFRAKEYDEAYRSSGHYLAWRAGAQ